MVVGSATRPEYCLPLFRTCVVSKTDWVQLNRVNKRVCEKESFAENIAEPEGTINNGFIRSRPEMVKSGTYIDLTPSDKSTPICK